MAIDSRRQIHQSPLHSFKPLDFRLSHLNSVPSVLISIQ